MEEQHGATLNRFKVDISQAKNKILEKSNTNTELETKLSELKQIIEAELVGASEKYAAKEEVRQRIQDIAIELVAAGKIQNDEQLKEFFETIKMAADALKMVPLAAFQR